METLSAPRLCTISRTKQLLSPPSLLLPFLHAFANTSSGHRAVDLGDFDTATASSPLPPPPLHRHLDTSLFEISIFLWSLPQPRWRQASALSTFLWSLPRLRWCRASALSALDISTSSSDSTTSRVRHLNSSALGLPRWVVAAVIAAGGIFTLGSHHPPLGPHNTGSELLSRRQSAEFSAAQRRRSGMSQRPQWSAYTPQPLPPSTPTEGEKQPKTSLPSQSGRRATESAGATPAPSRCSES